MYRSYLPPICFDFTQSLHQNRAQILILRQSLYKRSVMQFAFKLCETLIDIIKSVLSWAIEETIIQRNNRLDELICKKRRLAWRYCSNNAFTEFALKDGPFFDPTDTDYWNRLKKLARKCAPMFLQEVSKSLSDEQIITYYYQRLFSFLLELCSSDLQSWVDEGQKTIRLEIDPTSHNLVIPFSVLLPSNFFLENEIELTPENLP